MEDKKDQEEYKKRMKEVIENVEKTKDKDSKYTEQDVIEAKERTIESIKRRTQEDKYRNERIIVVLTHWIWSLYKYRPARFQEEIDTFYKIIVEQLKKPSPFLIKQNLNKVSYTLSEENSRRTILGYMARVLGMEIMNDFSKKYKINDILKCSTKHTVMTCLYCIGLIAFVITVPFLYVFFFIR